LNLLFGSNDFVAGNNSIQKKFKKYQYFLMKTVSKFLFILLVTIAIFAISCNASKKSNCGCPSKSKFKMDKSNRDLLVLFKQESSPQAIEHEVELLHELLFYVEKIDNVVISYEVININKYRIFSDKKIIRETISHKDLKPFVFLNNKN
jgi:hypothetical protein